MKNQHDQVEFEVEQEEEAAREAGAIGGIAGDEWLDPVERPLAEAGEGVSEGFELAEDALIAAAESDGGIDPTLDAIDVDVDSEHAGTAFGEADHESSSEVPGEDR